MRKAPVIFSVLLVCALSAVTAQANTVTPEQAKKFYSLRQKLRTLNSDVNQSMQQVVGNNSAFLCLNLINTQTTLVEAIEGHVSELATLAAVMRDNDDEFVVLHELRTMIPVGISAQANARQIINKAMSTCADVSTANVKGQAILGVLSEMNDVLTSLASRIGKDPN
jgi:hypothetical protein